MLYRYLGNKTELLEPILAVVKKNCPSGSMVCDVFSGTLSVGLELKSQGYRVAANDIMLFSAIIGEAFLVNKEIPPVALEALIPHSKIDVLYQEAEIWASHLTDLQGFSFLNNVQRRNQYIKLLALLLYLQNLTTSEIPDGWQRSDFFDTYTQSGRNSSFVSKRGTEGRRRFFSEANGHHIDAVMNQVRYWWRNELLPRVLYVTLLCVILRAIEKVSNTQGTYHDFPRATFDPRSLNPLTLEAPPCDVMLNGGDHIIGVEENSLEFVRHLPPHELLYIDPPYNFRQYTSYYFLPDIICRYSDIEDLDDYFANIQYVRGQNVARGKSWYVP